jgi:hypothetical protein
MRHDDQRIYRTFEEFEREELRRVDGFTTYVDEMLGEMFLEDLEFDCKTSRRGSADEDDE